MLEIKKQIASLEIPLFKMILFLLLEIKKQILISQKSHFKRILFLVLQIWTQFFDGKNFVHWHLSGQLLKLTRHKIQSWCQMQGWWVCWKTNMLTLKLRLMEKKIWGVISNQQKEIKSSPMSQICLRQQRLTMNYAPKKIRKNLQIQRGWYSYTWSNTNTDNISKVFREAS